MTESFSQTYGRLRSAQKGRARGAPAYSIYVNRPVGRVLAALAFKGGLSPNQVTGVSALFTASGIVLLTSGGASIAVGSIVWLLLAAGYAWDSADGQVARLQGSGSMAGEWLDHVVDSGKVVALHLAVAIGLYRFADLTSASLLLIPLGFAVVATVTFFAMLLNDLLKSARSIPSAVAQGGSSPVRSFLLLPTDYGLLCALFVLWGWPDVFLVVYSLTFCCCAAFLVLAGTKWFRDMRELG